MKKEKKSYFKKRRAYDHWWKKIMPKSVTVFLLLEKSYFNSVILKLLSGSSTSSLISVSRIGNTILRKPFSRW